jgi:ethanolamine utilization protein EutA
VEYRQMLSVGIDIGTSTSQLIFSYLKLENKAGYFSVPAVSIVEKNVAYQSQIYETPLFEDARIDAPALVRILEREYQLAGIQPSEVETGAVIITGESARKENAKVVLERLSGFAGDFVVSTAGPDLEALIAGQGSGAQKFSENLGRRVINLDIGGGTSNAVLFDRGKFVKCGCLDIGGRQVRLDQDGCVEYISESAAIIAEDAGVSLRLGKKASQEEIRRLCRAMVVLLEQMVGLAPRTPLYERIKTRGAGEFIMEEGPPTFICFSGGVGECIRTTKKEPFCFGDIGIILAETIRESRLCAELSVLKAEQTIRATVIGAGSYTTSISGSTVDYAKEILPLKNIPVLKLSADEENACWNGEEDVLLERARWFLQQSDSEWLAVSLVGKGNPAYEEIKRLCGALCSGLDQALLPEIPILLILQEDMAKALGQLMRRTMRGKRQIISLDGIRAEANNFIDLGKPLMNGLVVPVVVKTLVFH